MNSQPSIREQLKTLLRETIVRYPAQQFPREFQAATLQDWEERAKFCGFDRFSIAVKRARSYEEFFPHISKIEQLIPPPTMTDGEKWAIELKDLMRRHAQGEKFYTFGDVLEEVARRIKSGEIKPSDPSWYEWAAKFSRQAEEFHNAVADS